MSAGDVPVWRQRGPVESGGGVRPGVAPAMPAWPEALLGHLERLTAAVERVEGRLVGLEAALVKRGSL